MGGAEESPPRAGAPWSRDEEDRLFAAVRAGTPIETLVADFGRTEGALISRVRRWLPTEHPARHAGDAITGLRQVLADDPDYRAPVTIREELAASRSRRTRSRPYLSVSDVDLVTIAEALFETMEYQSMQTAARVFREVDERQLWSELVERRADLLAWRSEAVRTRHDAHAQATAAVARFRNMPSEP